MAAGDETKVDLQKFLVGISVPRSFIDSTVLVLDAANIVSAMTLATLVDSQIRDLKLPMVVANILIRASHTVRNLLFID